MFSYSAGNCDLLNMVLSGPDSSPGSAAGLQGDEESTVLVLVIHPLVPCPFQYASGQMGADGPELCNVPCRPWVSRCPFLSCKDLLKDTCDLYLLE